MVDTEAALRRRYGRIYIDYVTIPGATLREVADKYGVCHQRIFQIVNLVDGHLNDTFGIGSFRHWRRDQTKAQIQALRKYVNRWAQGG